MLGKDPLYICEVFTEPSWFFFPGNAKSLCFPDIGQTGWTVSSLSCISVVINSIESDFRSSRFNTDNDVFASFN